MHFRAALLVPVAFQLAGAICLAQTAQVNLSLALGSAPSSVTVGNPASYGFSVTVPSATTGVYLTVVFQPAIQFNPAASTGGCAANQAVNDPSTTVTCPSTGAAGTTTITVNVTPLTVGTQRVVAGVIGGDFDAAPSGNSATATTQVNSGPLVITSLTANPTVPRPAGTTITWTATAAGGNPPLQYSFYLYTASTNSWVLMQAYSTTNTWSWTPSQPGTYAMQVWVRNNGSTNAYDAWNGSGFFCITANAQQVPTITSFTPSPALPQRVGTTIGWTATATGGLPPLQYQFVLYSYTTGQWTVPEPYSTSNTYNWTPTQAGTYAIQVWVLNNGSCSAYDAWRGADQLVINP